MLRANPIGATEHIAQKRSPPSLCENDRNDRFPAKRLPKARKTPN
jgi:hypothetical protein